MLYTGALPRDNANGLYFVLSSSDVVVPTMCSGYCGWHSIAADAYNNLFTYGYVGSTLNCAGSGNTCTPVNSDNAPNSVEGDGMVSMLAHEIGEATTNPWFSAWVRNYKLNVKHVSHVILLDCICLHPHNSQVLFLLTPSHDC